MDSCNYILSSIPVHRNVLILNYSYLLFPLCLHYYPVQESIIIMVHVCYYNSPYYSNMDIIYATDNYSF